MFSSIFTCLPVQRFWHQLGWAVDGCLPRFTLWYVLPQAAPSIFLVSSDHVFARRYTNASVNIVTDLMTALLPLPVIKGLDIPKRQKSILMGVFAAGIL